MMRIGNPITASSGQILLGNSTSFDFNSDDKNENHRFHISGGIWSSHLRILSMKDARSSNLPSRSIGSRNDNGSNILWTLESRDRRVGRCGCWLKIFRSSIVPMCISSEPLVWNTKFTTKIDVSCRLKNVLLKIFVKIWLDLADILLDLLF